MIHLVFIVTEVEESCQQLLPMLHFLHSLIKTAGPDQVHIIVLPAKHDSLHNVYMSNSIKGDLWSFLLNKVSVYIWSECIVCVLVV